jgi:hypothetical protein
MKGLSKKFILDSPEGQALYRKYLASRMAGGGKKMVGKGVFDGFIDFLKKSKVISKIGDVILPVAGGALAGLLTANPLAAGVGAATGSAANEFIKSQGFGKRKRRRGGCNSCLAISPNGQRLGQQGRGLTIAYNGTFQDAKPPSMRGGGGSAFGSISSEYGQVRF